MIWIDGTLRPESKARISLLSHSLHYGTAAFEGIRFYKTKSGSAVFRLDEHIKRLIYSAHSFGMKPRWIASSIKKAVIDTVKAQKLQTGYIRPIMFYGKSALGVHPKKNKSASGSHSASMGKVFKETDSKDKNSKQIR